MPGFYTETADGGVLTNKPPGTRTGAGCSDETFIIPPNTPVLTKLFAGKLYSYLAERERERGERNVLIQKVRSSIGGLKLGKKAGDGPEMGHPPPRPPP
jgi:hypothetical protein